jgi:hypothetical protein
MPKIFISATTFDLAQARLVAKRGLETVNYEVVEQSTFETDYGTMIDRLRRKLAGCDGIVHIAGRVYGAEPDPKTLPPGTPRRSYTQWEYHLAQALEKQKRGFRIYAYLTADDYPAAELAEPEELRELQQAHRELINPIKSTMRLQNNAQLEEKVKEIQLHVEQLKRRNRRVTAALAAMILAVLVIALGGGLNQYACQAPGIYQICKAYGWGGVPTLAQELDLQSAAQAGCAALRRYAQRSDVPEVLRRRAQNAVSNRITEVEFQWGAQDNIAQPITEALGMATLQASEAQAKAEALARVEQSALQKCLPPTGDLLRRPATGPTYRLSDIAYQCEPAPDGTRCGATAIAYCQLEQKREVPIQRCGV